MQALYRVLSRRWIKKVEKNGVKWSDMEMRILSAN